MMYHFYQKMSKFIQTNRYKVIKNESFYWNFIQVIGLEIVQVFNLAY